MRRPLHLLVALVLACTELVAGPAHAQSGTADIEPPVIELEALGEASAASSQVFTAQVVDDRGLRDVLLYHRRAGGRPFESVPMRALGDSAFHSVTLATDPTDLRSIEYYIQARDAGGNRSVAGFAFEPFVRRLNAPAANLAAGEVPVTIVPADRRVGSRTSPASDTAPSIGSRVRWWHVALGVVAVGSLAALAGGDDGGGAGGDVPAGPTVPFTVTLGEPAQ